MRISILRRLEPPGNRSVVRPVPGIPARCTPERGSYLESGKKTAVLLDAERLLGKLHFLYGHDATIRALRSRARSRLPATRGGLFLWPLLARAFRGQVAARHRGACGGPG